MMRTSDAAANLMQLSEPELVGPIDEDGIGGGNVDTAFDDGSAHQQVAAMVIEIQHHAFQFLLLHASVHDANACIG